MNKALFNLPQEEIKLYGLENLTYGSLTEKGLESMVKELSHIPYICGLDLGCGDGELIHHLQKNLPLSSWEGVEISEHRIERRSRDVVIWQGDMLKENLRPYNVLHADNLCLEEGIADKLEIKIAQEFKGLYISYRTPQNICFLKKAFHLKTVLTETTWAKHPIHFYMLD